MKCKSISFNYKLLAWLIGLVVGVVSFNSFAEAPKTTTVLHYPLRNWGLTNYFPSHIDAKKAWTLSKGSKKVVVAIIDTGVDFNHSNLHNNLWRKENTNEYGWDFVKNAKNPFDFHGHGTHIAGIIGASFGGGAVGVAPNVSLMILRYYSANNTGAQNLANTIKAIDYAIDNGAHIINYSGGGVEYSTGEYEAIKRAKNKGILFVGAAGNESRNVDKAKSKYYPAAYNLSNIISVGGTTIRNNMLPSSNWGQKSVDVVAPAEYIYSTLPNNKYGYLSGTSQATAFVSGLAALILAENPDCEPEQIKKIIINTVDKLVRLKNKVASGGRINAYKALKTRCGGSHGKD